MTNLRQAKIDNIAHVIPALKIQGNPDADLLVVGWGGTFGHLYSAVEALNAEGEKVALAHFNYINPLPKNTAEVLTKYKKIIVCELNNGQFAGYLRSKVDGINPLKYNKVEGQPFLVQELVDHFKTLLDD